MRILRIFSKDNEPHVEWLCEDCDKLHDMPLSELAMMVLADAIEQEMGETVDVSNEATEINYDDIEHETDQAVMFNIDNLLVWLPKSQITYDQDELTIELPVWLASEKGLI